VRGAALRRAQGEPELVFDDHRLGGRRLVSTSFREPVAPVDGGRVVVSFQHPQQDLGSILGQRERFDLPQELPSDAAAAMCTVYPHALDVHLA